MLEEPEIKRWKYGINSNTMSDIEHKFQIYMSCCKKIAVHKTRIDFAATLSSVGKDNYRFIN